MRRSQLLFEIFCHSILLRGVTRRSKNWGLFKDKTLRIARGQSLQPFKTTFKISVYWLYMNNSKSKSHSQTCNVFIINEKKKKKTNVLIVAHRRCTVRRALIARSLEPQPASHGQVVVSGVATSTTARRLTSSITGRLLDNRPGRQRSHRRRRRRGDAPAVPVPVQMPVVGSEPVLAQDQARRHVALLRVGWALLLVGRCGGGRHGGGDGGHGHLRRHLGTGHDPVRRVQLHQLLPPPGRRQGVGRVDGQQRVRVHEGVLEVGQGLLLAPRAAARRRRRRRAHHRVRCRVVERQPFLEEEPKRKKKLMEII